MAVMVTGGSGFVGINLVKKLGDQGAEVVSFSRGGFQGEFEKFIGPSICRVHFVKGDILNAAEIRRAIREHGAEVLIHASAMTPATPSMERSLWRGTVQVNVEGTVNTLEAALAEKVPRFVYISSVSVYGEQDPDQPVLETARPRPRVVYGITKYAGELLSLRFSDLFEGLDVRAVRISTIYGPMERPTRTRHLPSHIYDWCAAALSGKRIEVWENVNLKRDFTYVEDIVDGIILVSFASFPQHRVYNISSGIASSLLEVLNTIQKLEPGFRFEVIPPTGREEFMRNLPRGPLDITRAHQEFNFKPRYTLEMGLQKYLEWLRTSFNIHKGAEMEREQHQPEEFV
ncbi:MAG: NAD(P)-dependent oxidoreductase [Deltaproteobacteria bacterium]|nr:NAD(P)-dependent oxidoreductase [Deltaproteobacteria bacterium]MBW2306580.1 NAD(P)-dependent oxidoreductase [Deltaproteobacteria bacterium]